MKIGLEFNDVHEAGAVLAWAKSNLGQVLKAHREARTYRDQVFATNTAVELRGLRTLIAAFEAADVRCFEGMEHV